MFYTSLVFGKIPVVPGAMHSRLFALHVSMMVSGCFRDWVVGFRDGCFNLGMRKKPLTNTASIIQTSGNHQPVKPAQTPLPSSAFFSAVQGCHLDPPEGEPWPGVPSVTRFRIYARPPNKSKNSPIEVERCPLTTPLNCRPEP